MNRVFNADQIRLGGFLLTGSSQGLYYDGNPLAQGVLAAPIGRQLVAGSGLLGFTNASYTSNMDLNYDMEFHITAGAGLTVGTDNIYIGANQVTNSMLAGSIVNSKLSNSAVSFGADVSVSLGGDDATPKFNLIDATGYLPTRFALASIPADRVQGGIADSQLSKNYIQTGEVDPLGGLEWDTANNDLQIKAGGVTNTHLAGSIADGKLAQDYIQTSEVDNSSIEFNGGTLNAKALGITNGMLAGSIANTKLVNSSVGVDARSGILADVSTLALGGNIILDLDLDPTLDFNVGGEVGIADGGVGNTQLGVNYAGSPAKGGAANSLVNSLSAVGGGGLAITDSNSNADDFDGSASNFVSVDTTVVRTAGAQSIGGVKTFSDAANFSSSVTVNGDLQVRGSTISVTTNEVNIGDNIIVLNNDLTSAIAPEQGGVHIKRGSQGTTLASLVWDPTTGWMAGIQGAETKLHTLHDTRMFSKQMAQVNTARMDFGDALGLTAGTIVMDGVPNAVVSLENTYPGNNDLVAVLVTGVDTSGIDVIFSNTLPNQYYKLKAMVSAI